MEDSLINDMNKKAKPKKKDDKKEVKKDTKKDSKKDSKKEEKKDFKKEEAKKDSKKDANKDEKKDEKKEEKKEEKNDPKKDEKKEGKRDEKKLRKTKGSSLPSTSATNATATPTITTSTLSTSHPSTPTNTSPSIPRNKPSLSPKKSPKMEKKSPNGMKMLRSDRSGSPLARNGDNDLRFYSDPHIPFFGVTSPSIGTLTITAKELKFGNNKPSLSEKCRLVFLCDDQPTVRHTQSLEVSKNSHVLTDDVTHQMEIITFDPKIRVYFDKGSTDLMNLNETERETCAAACVKLHLAENRDFARTAVIKLRPQVTANKSFQIEVKLHLFFQAKEFQSLMIENAFATDTKVWKTLFDKVPSLNLDKLFEDDSGSGGGISEEKVAHSFLEFFYVRGEEKNLMKEIIREEVNGSKNPEEIFRGTSFGIKIVSEYMRMTGRGYLVKIVRPLVIELVKRKTVIEINPKKGSNAAENEKDAEKELGKNRKELKKHLTRFIQAICGSAGDFPTEICWLASELHNAIKEKYGNTKGTKSDCQALGTLLFLRFICPSLVLPHKYRYLESQYEFIPLPVSNPSSPSVQTDSPSSIGSAAASGLKLMPNMNLPKAYISGQFLPRVPLPVSNTSSQILPEADSPPRDSPRSEDPTPPSPRTINTPSPNQSPLSSSSPLPASSQAVELRASTTKTLTYITKAIQQLANRLPFGDKEAYMNFLNPFLESSWKKPEKLFKLIVKRESESSISTLPQQSGSPDALETERRASDAKALEGSDKSGSIRVKRRRVSTEAWNIIALAGKHAEIPLFDDEHRRQMIARKKVKHQDKKKSDGNGEQSSSSPTNTAQDEDTSSDFSTSSCSFVPSATEG